MSKKKTQEEYLQQIREVWGDRYDLSKVQYISDGKPITVICRKHGEFYPLANNFLHRHGCKKCSHSMLTQEEYFAKAREIHNNYYDYDETTFRGMKHKILVKCPVHGEFWQYAKLHLRGSGCRECWKDKYKNTFVERAKEIWGDEYDFSEVNYTKADNKIKVICKKHGPFYTCASSLLKHHGCPICNNSHGEHAIRKYLTDNHILFIQEKTFEDCRDSGRLRFDFFLPDNKICIEYQGQQHYQPDHFFDYSGDFVTRQRRDQIKRDYCKANNIALVEIRYDEDVQERLKNII